MNNQNLMVSRDAKGLVDPTAEFQRIEDERRLAEQQFLNSFDQISNSSQGFMVRRDEVMANQDEKMFITETQVEEYEAPEKDFGMTASVNPVMQTQPVMQTRQPVVQSASQPVQSTIMQSNDQTAKPMSPTAAKTKEALMRTVQQQQSNAKQQVAAEKAQKKATNAANTTEQKPSGPAVATAETYQPVKIATQFSPDDLTKLYITMFEKHFGIKLSSSICYENMRRFCEINTKEPDKMLYFIENTYRFSTLLYFADALPIIFIATTVSETNRKNMLNYIVKEVENGALSYDDLKALRMNRYMRKHENMNVNDTITVTLGASSLSNELIANIKQRFNSICSKMKRFNKSVAKSIDKMDDTAINDIIYIYSNCWYFLQAFENVLEVRKYIMSITDDTRKNMKV